MSSGGTPSRRDRSQLRQEGRRRRRRVVWSAGAAVVVLLLAAGGAVAAAMLTNRDDGADTAATQAADTGPIVFPDDEPAAEAGAEPCTTVRVLSSFENAEMVAKLVEGYNAQPRDVEGSCVTVVAQTEKSGVAATDAGANFKDRPEDERPIVWIPDATSWLNVARYSGGGASVPKQGTSLGASHIVLAMPDSLADAIGWIDERPSWSEVFAVADDEEAWADVGRPELGAFKLGKTSPLIASSGEAALLASYGSVAGSIADLTAEQIEDDEVTEEVRQHELATSHYMATPEHFLWHARQAEETGSVADFLSAVIVDEKSVWDYNRGITSRDGVSRVQSTPPVEQLVPIYPTDGFYTADNPAAVLIGPWVDADEKAAGDDFVRYAVTKQGQQIVRDAGYRDLNDEMSPVVQQVGRFTASPHGALQFPGQKVLITAHQAFPEVRKRAQVLFLVDVSGSMAEPIATGDTKLAAAKDAITQALEHFSAGDNVGLAAFSDIDAGPITPGMVGEVADIGPNRTLLLRALGALKPIEFTPLYSAVDAFVAQQAAAFDPDRINAIVLLSDGKNETFAPSVDANQMLANISAHHHHTPVLVFTLAYGADADVATLQAIASATGAHYYDATDPTKVKDVLGDLVTSF
ncbi:substrate-binding domain-containing protein [Agromyces sp. Marseille-P2726]|uniref:vWA domain-containing protein n=1 Tax=Agromyces sp. Marseille-P2726 TaxID=2709132 RepID=UPI00156EDE66|nr:substrate-binding domain-containing protein [Agromyces sp. Marseille-P2726]